MIFNLKKFLLNALNEYSGTILFVSHDIDFINNLATKIFELTPECLYSYEGNYDSFLEYKKIDKSQIASSKTAMENVKDTAKDKVNIAQLDTNSKKALKSLEGKIAKLEQDIEAFNKAFFNVSYGTKEYDTLASKLKLAKESLEKAYGEWGKLSEQ